MERFMKHFIQLLWMINAGLFVWLLYILWEKFT